MRAMLILWIHVSQNPSPHTTREVQKCSFRSRNIGKKDIGFLCVCVVIIRILALILLLDKLPETAFSHLQNQHYIFCGKEWLAQKEDLKEVVPLLKEEEFPGTCQFQSHFTFAIGWDHKGSQLSTHRWGFLSIILKLILVLLPQRSPASSHAFLLCYS